MANLIQTPTRDWEELREAINSLELRGEAWLCRGAVRCDLLGELKSWDDFDVIVEEDETALLTSVERAVPNFSRTFYGGYSFRLIGSRKVDIWSLTSTRGQKCKSLADALLTFEFNVDAIARSIRTGEIVDPLQVRGQILGRKLKLQDHIVSERNPYLPWKAAYLVIRHGFDPDASVSRLWIQRPSAAGLPDKAIPSLREELSQLQFLEQIEEIRARASLHSGFIDYVNALLPPPEITIAPLPK